MAEDDPLIPLDEWIAEAAWPLAGIVPDDLGAVLLTPPEISDGTLAFEVVTAGEVVFRVPGVPDLALVIAGGPEGSTALRVEIDTAPFEVRLVDVPLSLRVPASVLRPVADPGAASLEVQLGELDVSLDGEGNLDIDLSAAGALPRCDVAGTGVLVEVGRFRWITPATSPADRPAGTPAGFTGLYLDDVLVEIPGLPTAAAAWSLEDAFLGTGGFSGRVRPTGITLGWDGRDFTGTAVGELFGFKGGLSAVDITFHQSALTGFDVRGDVYLPYVERRVGLVLGLAGDGSLTATAGMPLTNDPGVTEGGAGALVELDVGGVLGLALDQVHFEVPARGPAAVELTGVVDVRVPASVAELEIPPIGLNGLRIDVDGNVTTEGGWQDLPQAVAVRLAGVSLEISRLGFGQDGGRPWIGLNGGLKLAEGLPMGASVEGLRIAWDRAGGLPQVSLSGVGLELSVPGAFSFAGSVAFVSEPAGNSFRGHGVLGLPTLKMSVEANLVIGRSPTGETFFFFHLAAELPVGIPLLQTGAAVYGFQGLVANNMAPDRRPDEPWYHGWYVREPKGATSGRKWEVRPRAFAIGLGTTIGTAPDDGFSFSTKALLVIVLPGPVLLLEGKGSFLSSRPSAGRPQQEGTFEALLSLDVPAKLFQANLAATYGVEKLLTARGGAEVALSWVVPRPERMWHIYLGEDQPPERRWQASVLSILDAHAYLMIEAPSPARPPIRAGAWAGIDESWRFGPVAIALRASADVYGEVSIEPQQLSGEVHLRGQLEVTAFGARVMIRASADTEARGPTPWWVSLALEAAISIDLWLVEFEWSETIRLEWGDRDRPPPSPATPLVARIALEHALSSESFDAYVHERGQAPRTSAPVVPPDARPVVILHRPVRDLAQVGSPSSPGKPAPDAVGPAAFSYRLGHVVLVRTSGGDRVIAAAGVAQVAQGTVTLPGSPALPGVVGARMVLGGGAPARITSHGGTVGLSPAPSLGAGRHSYRVLGGRLGADVQVTGAARASASTADVALAASPGQGGFAGGTLSVGGRTHPVLDHAGTTVTVRVAGTLPATGPGRLEPPESPRLDGAWLPADPADPAPTKLMISARTPFAYYRRSDRSVMDDVLALAPGYVCGPEPQAEPICVGFDDAPLGPVEKRLHVELLTVEPHGDVLVGGGVHHHLGVGFTPSGELGHGTATVHLDGPVERIILHCDTVEGAHVAVLRDGHVVDEARVVIGAPDPYAFDGDFDAIRVSGTGARVHRICFWPGWVCTGFEAASFPQRSTGEQSYAGLTLQSAGRMEVTADGVLTVSTPPARPGKLPPQLDLERMREPFPFVELPRVLERFHVTPLPVPKPPVPGPILAPAASPRPEPLSLMPADVRMLRAAGDRAVIGGHIVAADGGASTAATSLALVLPAPATRVRVLLDGEATITAFAGTSQVGQAQGSGGDEFHLSAGGGWVDRVVLTAPGALRVRRVCVDAGDLGWERFEQWLWGQSVQRSVEALYSDEPVLEPGDYRLDVHVAWANEKAGNAESWSVASAPFTVGPPPGLPAPGPAGRYPAEGALTELATYVASTLPAAGARPHYRAHDVAVSFRATHVSRMYLAAGSPLSVTVVDANGEDVRTDAVNAWGRAPDVELSAEEIGWIRTLHNDGTASCASVDLARVARNEHVSAGAGELLQPDALHTGHLRAGAKTVFSFDFTTSRFADFRHHLSSFVQRVRESTAPAPVALPAALAAAASARTAVAAAEASARASKQSAEAGNPSPAQLDARESDIRALRTARAALLAADESAFRATTAAYGLAGERPLPQRVEVTRLPGAFLLESPEPLHLDRVRLEIARAPSPPLRFTTIHFADVTLAPDIGAFTLEGREWSTSVELRVDAATLRPRIPTEPLRVTVPLDRARSISAVVAAQEGASIRLDGDDGNVVATPVTQVAGAAGDVTITLTGDSLSSATLSGAGFAVRSVTIGEPFAARPPITGARLSAVRPPASADDEDHHVEVTAHGTQDIGGWEIRWLPARSPATPSLYHRFAPGTQLGDGVLARVYGGRATPPIVPGVEVHGGGTVGAVPVDGVVLQLVDAGGAVVDELAMLGAYAAVAGVTTVPNGDRSRVLLLLPAGVPQDGHWKITGTFARAADLDLPRLSVGGRTDDEVATIAFTA